MKAAQIAQKLKRTVAAVYTRKAKLKTKRI